MAAFRRVLVATDLSTVSSSLVAVGADVAARYGAELVVLHVFDPEAYAQILGATGMPIDEYVGNLRRELLDHIQTARARGARLEVVEGGQVAGQILGAASRLGADLIVIGTHARRGLRRALLGSVAEDVLRRARAPVLVAPVAVLETTPELAAAP